MEVHGEVIQQSKNMEAVTLAFRVEKKTQIQMLLSMLVVVEFQMHNQTGGRLLPRIVDF